MVVRIDLKRPPHWRDKALRLTEFDAWDGEWRKRLGWRAGLSFWAATNAARSRVLLSRHWPHLLCWSWSIWVGLHRKGYDGPRRFDLKICRSHRFAELRFFGPYVRLDWQNYSYMPALKYKHEAPRLCWQNHLEHAEPLGSA